MCRYRWCDATPIVSRRRNRDGQRLHRGAVLCATHQLSTFEQQADNLIVRDGLVDLGLVNAANVRTIAGCVVGSELFQLAWWLQYGQHVVA